MLQALLCVFPSLCVLRVPQLRVTGRPPPQSAIEHRLACPQPSVTCVDPNKPRAALVLRHFPERLLAAPAGSMATTATNPTVDELEKKEEDLFRTGPLSVLTTSVKTNSQVRGHRVQHLLMPPVGHTASHQRPCSPADAGPPCAPPASAGPD